MTKSQLVHVQKSFDGLVLPVSFLVSDLHNGDDRSLQLSIPISLATDDWRFFDRLARLRDYFDKHCICVFIRRNEVVIY